MRERQHTKAPTFSIVTIVRNEGARLPTLLHSIEAFRSRGGDVVVLDTGSDDDTVEIARASGCTVAIQPKRFNRTLTAKQAHAIQKAFAKGGEKLGVRAGDRVFNIATARNTADALARHPFILGMDASDVAHAMDVEFLDRQVKAGKSEVLLFETRRLHRGRWVLEMRDYFHDRRATHWIGRAHNQVAPLRSTRPRRMAVLSRDRLRVTHHTDPEKSRGYQLTGLALDVLASPDAVHRRLLLGYELAARGHTQSALALFLGIDRPEAMGELRAAALSMASTCVAALSGSDEEVTDLLFKASRRDPLRRHPLLQLARHALAAQRFQEAASYASAALAIPARVTFTELEENLRDGPHAILYWALLWLGRVDEARKHFKICLAIDPANPLYRDHARFFD